MEQTIYYFNNENHGVAISADEFHSTRLLPKNQGMFITINIPENHYLFIKKFDKIVLIQYKPISSSNFDDTSIGMQ